MHLDLYRGLLWPPVAGGDARGDAPAQHRAPNPAVRAAAREWGGLGPGGLGRASTHGAEEADVGGSTSQREGRE